MLTLPLIHPPLVHALALAGHGAKMLIADGNFPYATVRHPMAELVHLNLAPGLLTVDQVLTPVLSAVTIEAAQIMGPDDGSEVPAHRAYRAAVPGVSFDRVGRWDFYDIVRSQDVGLIVATGDQRQYANLLLTIGLA